MNIAKFLRAVPPFDKLSDETLDALAFHAREVTFRKHEQILRAGDPGDAMYVVAGGKVLVKVADVESERHLCWLGPGEVFGEMALLTGEPRAADVVADEKTICIAIDRLPFHALVRHSREVAAFLTELVGRRLLEGKHIAQVGKYRVLHAIGRGGMGTVFAGYHEHLRRPVALKMLNHELVLDEEFATRFAAEASTIAGLHHPNIVQVFDHETAYATQFIVMELLQGETLGDRMDRDRQLGEGLVRRAVMQLAGALGHAHERGITHRDVKPDNVMLCGDGSLKLMDFGIAGRLGGDEQWQPVGTPLYMSPEQMRGQDIDQRTDIYALGVMAFAMLTGDAPWFDEDVDALAAMKEKVPLPAMTGYRLDVSEAMSAFVSRACSPNPAHRFGSCDDVVRHFEQGAVGGRPGVRSQRVTLTYDPGVEDAVCEAVDRMAASLAGEPVVVRVELDDEPEG